MSGSLFTTLARPLLFALEPERAHGLSIAALRCGFLPAGRPPAHGGLEVTVAGLRFPNPLGIAAGYDKNAEVPDALLRLGFGHAEVGTVTPLPQAGNPRPRIFRLEADRAIINRLGFNNEGHEAAADRLRARTGSAGIVGVNIGANKDSADRIADYRLGVRRFAPLASYLTVNVSSPNTPGLRDLQARDSLAALLSAVTDERSRCEGARPPIFLKIAPDLDEAGIEDVASVVARSAIDGVIVSNTTLARTGVSDSRAGEAGGLSGRPLFARSTAVLARMRRLLGPEPALIGVGGVDSADTALAKIRAGADLVQLYTGFVYGGPSLAGAILNGMAETLAREGIGHVSELRDADVGRWAAAPIG